MQATFWSNVMYIHDSLSFVDEGWGGGAGFDPDGNISSCLVLFLCAIDLNCLCDQLIHHDRLIGHPWSN